MSKARVRIPAPLRAYASGASEVAVEASTVREALASLGRQHGGLIERVLEPSGSLRSFVNVFVGEDDVRALGGLDSALPEGAIVSIIPAVAGGAARLQAG
ncbi:MAG: MoaD/ThiS family protein [Planctomycetes bacterium]|nr:MoaD/ThiS family protein [Planctomycetota bacterium]